MRVRVLLGTPKTDLMEKNMHIETKRLRFREWTENDVDFLVDGQNDFDVAKNLTVPFPYTKQDAI